ncbi:MAG TPA: deoxyribonuclease IV [Candidatus Saccharimonadales bacterium]|nr:deoxyribonuclease IV [Candidatus Saccharimonadales bacterium]
MYIGAHVGTSGGLKKAIERGQAIGAEALQIFPSAPVQWQIRGFPDDDAAWFKEEWPKHFKEVVFHGIYLINLAGESSENLQKSVQALIDTLKLAPKLGITKTIFHTGTYIDGKLERISQIEEVLKKILGETPPESKLVFENTAGSTIGAKLEDLQRLIDMSRSPERVGVCLDTCHAYASGYDITNEDGYKKFIEAVNSTIGANKVLAWHLNDSIFELGAKRDRHENIGEGKLGAAVFRFILNDSVWASTAGFLEVPGFDGNGPDGKNIEILKNLRG